MLAPLILFKKTTIQYSITHAGSDLARYGGSCFSILAIRSNCAFISLLAKGCFLVANSSADTPVILQLVTTYGIYNIVSRRISYYNYYITGEIIDLIFPVFETK